MIYIYMIYIYDIYIYMIYIYTTIVNNSIYIHMMCSFTEGQLIYNENNDKSGNMSTHCMKLGSNI